jgi:hypothetical protein
MLVKFGIHYESQCDYNCDEICESIGIKGSSGCTGSCTIYVGLIILWESIVCPHDEFSKWHVRECLLGEGESRLRCAKTIVTNTIS